MHRCPSGCDKVSDAPQKHSVQSLTVAAVSGCTSSPAGLMLNLAEGWGCSQSPPQSWGAQEGDSPTLRTWGRGWGGFGGSSPGQHSNLQQVGHIPGLGAGAGLPWGPCRLEKTGRVKPCSGEGHSGEQQSGPRDLQKPRGAVGGWKPRVKSSHTSRMRQCHRPQWP